MNLGEKEAQLKHCLQKLHIDYINFCSRCSTEPSFNFWGIHSFQDYIRRFGLGHYTIEQLGMQVVLDFALQIGYDRTREETEDKS